MQQSSQLQVRIYDEVNITNPLNSVTNSTPILRLTSPIPVDNPLTPSIHQNLSSRSPVIFNSTNSIDLQDLSSLPQNVSEIEADSVGQKLSIELLANRNKDLRFKIVSDNTLDYTEAEQQQYIDSGIIRRDLVDEKQSDEIFSILRDAHDRRTLRFTAEDDNLATITLRFGSNLARILKDPIEVDTIIRYLNDGSQNPIHIIFKSLFETWGIENLSKLRALMIPFGTSILIALTHSFAPLWTVIVQYTRLKYNKLGQPFVWPRILYTTLHRFYYGCIDITIWSHSSFVANCLLFRRPRSANEEITPVVEGVAEIKINEIEIQAKDKHQETLRLAKIASHIADENGFFTITIQKVKENFKLIFGPMFETLLYPFKIARETFTLIYGALNLSSILSWMITGTAIFGPFVVMHFGSLIFFGSSPIIIAFTGGLRFINYFIEWRFSNTIPRIIHTTPPIIPVSPTLIQQILDFIADGLEKAANSIKDISKTKKE